MTLLTSVRRERLLDPVARISEVLFGLIMALTFTTTLGAATAGREEVGTLLVGVLGCNIAWGLVDAVMFLMSDLVERGHGFVTIHAVRAAPTPDDAHRVITGALSPVMASVLTTADLERVRQALVGLRSLAETPSLTRQDWLRALGVFLLVFLSTFPVAIPFLLVRDVQLASRLSNLVALVMMFAAGALLARYGGFRPWRTGLGVMLLGVVLVAIAIAFGG